MPKFSPLTAVFRADASPTLGGGHVVRCLALAEALRRSGFTCRFAVNEETTVAVPALARSSDRGLIAIPSPADAVALERAVPDGCDLLVVDHYAWDADRERLCRPWARQILVIDDLANRRHDCDMLLDQTFGRDAADYADLTPAGCRRLVGSSYALLRPEFAAARHAALARRTSGRLDRILISMGLTDPADGTSLVLAGILESGLPLPVDIVLGSAAPHLEAVRSLVRAHAGTVRLHTDVTDMTGLMREADLAFGAAGSSAWERCVLGLPTAFVVIADNQEKVAAGLSRAGAAISLGRISEVTRAAVADLVRDLHATPGQLAVMSARAARLCDGRGAARVAMVIAPQHARDGGAIELRPAAQEDTDRMFQWQTAPDVRRYSRNPDAPGRSTHEAWMRARLADTDCLFNVVLHRGKPVGVLRLDRRGDSSFEVSILIAPEAQGLGIGLAAVTMGRRLVPEARLLAEVQPQNEASCRLFRAAGFELMSRNQYLAEPLDPAARRPARDDAFDRHGMEH